MYQPAPDMDDETIDLGELLGVLIENRWLIVAITALAFLVGVYKAYTAVPIFRADGLLQVEEKSGGGLTNLDATSLLEGYTPVNAEIEILRSRSVLGEVVDNLTLDISARPEFSTVIGAALARRASASERPSIRVDSLHLPDSVRSFYMELVATGGGRFELYDADEQLLARGVVGETVSFSIDAGTVSLFVSALQGENGQTFAVSKRARISGIQSLKGRLTVAEQGEWSGILSISVQGPSPRLVRDQVNEIANVFVRQNVERKSAEAQQTLEFLDEQLPMVRTNMESAELALNSYRLEKGSIDLPLETQTILQTIVSVEAQINKLRQERDKVTQAFTPAHPTVVALDRQIERLNVELNGLNNQVRDLPTTQQELLSLIRDVEVTTALFRSLLDTAQELRVVKAGTIGNVRVIDYAVMPTEPVLPNRIRIVLLALLLGGLVGIAVAFTRKALRSGVEDPDLVERHFNIPIYATISHSPRQDRIFKDLQAEKTNNAILAVDRPDDPAIESIRNLRTALHFGMMNVDSNAIMIAGPSPSVGKSFVSVNLAAVLASNDKKVLLIDGDLRRGHLHRYLGVEKQPGLSEFISGEVPIGDVLHQTTVPGLTVIPTGTYPPNPAELLLHQRFSNCLGALAPSYDHIIIDSPPILAATDATIIGQMVGGTLMVLKAGEHPMREIEQAVKRLQQTEVNLRGILFNDVRSQSRNYGSGKYNYQYAYTKA